MPMPLRYAHASDDFERFIVDARDELGLTTRHQTYTAVQAVLWVFRRRLDVEQVIRFANFLPPVLSAIFLQGYVPSAVPVAFGDEEQWRKEAQGVRAEHNFAPDAAVPRVAVSLRRHVDVAEFEALLTEMPSGSAVFWSGDGA